MGDYKISEVKIISSVVMFTVDTCGEL